MLRRIVAFFLVLAASPASASTVCVNPSGTGGCFSTVQAAVDVATPGSILEVAAGTYAEDVVVPTPKRVTIRGAGAGVTVIQADGLAPAITASDGLVLASSTVRGNNVAAAPFGGGVYGIKSLQIDHSTIRDNHGWGVNGYRSVRITNTTISGNEDSEHGEWDPARLCRVGRAVA